MCHKNDALFEQFLTTATELAAKKVNLQALVLAFPTLVAMSFSTSVLFAFTKLLESRLETESPDFKDFQSYIATIARLDNQNKKEKKDIGNEYVVFPPLYLYLVTRKLIAVQL